MNYDIIGDIHGHASELERLLQKLGYQLNEGVYAHSANRKVIFLGDFIDRGPKIRETLHIVKNMCDAGNAEAIMGNHEFNAVCFDTPNQIKGGFQRAHTFTEINQHFETLKQFKNFNDEWKMFLNWFKVLPIFIEKEIQIEGLAYKSDFSLRPIEQSEFFCLASHYWGSARPLEFHPTTRVPPDH